MVFLIGFFKDIDNLFWKVRKLLKIRKLLLWIVWYVLRVVIVSLG